MKNFDLVYTGRHILCVVLLLCGLCATARADENPEDPDAAPGRQLPDRTVTGTVTERSNKNANLPTGDIEIIAEKLVVLHTAETPPFTIEDESDGGDDIRNRSYHNAFTPDNEYTRYRIVAIHSDGMVYTRTAQHRRGSDNVCRTRRTKNCRTARRNAFKFHEFFQCNNLFRNG